MSTTTDAKATTTKASVLDDVPLPIPNLALPQLVFVLNRSTTDDDKRQRLDRVLKLVEDDAMAPYLSHLMAQSHVPTNERTRALLDRLKDDNDKRYKELDAKLNDARDNLGPSEVSDALREIAAHLAKIGENVSPLPLFRPARSRH